MLLSVLLVFLVLGNQDVKLSHDRLFFIIMRLDIGGHVLVSQPLELALSLGRGFDNNLKGGVDSTVLHQHFKLRGTDLAGGLGLVLGPLNLFLFWEVLCSSLFVSLLYDARPLNQSLYCD